MAQIKDIDQLLSMEREKERVELDALFEEELFGFSSIKIGLASPEQIRAWSHGEVKKPETINYRTFRAEKYGLFCERIFGPTKDYECFCGRWKSIKHKGRICENCGVEVTTSDVRRQRMGHIELVSPVSHIWFFKRIPSPMALLLDISVRDLERVLYFESYIITSVKKDIPLYEHQLLSEEQYQRLKERYKDAFTAGMGAEAIKELLKKMDLEELAKQLREQMREEASLQRQRKVVRRLEIVEAFLRSGNKPEWMILEVIPVIPPELRPMVQLDGGRFATSDLNDLYRRVINRNNRLRRLLDLKAPEVIIRNEKRMLQEAVDALFDNGRRGRAVKGPGNRPLKSLSDMLKGKQGRFRQNLLGKRVDYSGRSVIVVGPELKIHQCGLPKRMALELFKPFVMKRLVALGIVHNIKSAKKMIEHQDPQVWDILEEVIKEHPVLLNRAPTLHRLGIQAFEPVLVEGDAIKIHPLVCTAFNADFDGDQMAVHIPLSLEAQLESKVLMLSANNLLSPAHGKPLVTPTQDMVLGCCYLTKEGKTQQEKVFSSMDEMLAAFDAGVVELHTRVKVHFRGKGVCSTVGRFIFNEILPEGMEFVDTMVDKKTLERIIADCYRRFGMQKTVQLLDRLKELGFHYATIYGASIGIEDIKIPEGKGSLIKESQAEAESVYRQYHQGVITEEERYNKLVDLWTRTTENIADVLFDELSKDQEGFNSIYLMVLSGARGSKQQVRQLAGMRGLMAKPSGEIIELPITANFREGLSVLEYFISTHGARKGLADTALKTADAGYLTRRLIDIAQDVVITQRDCGTINGIIAEAIKEGDEVIESLKDRIIGRVALEDVVDPLTGEVLVPAGNVIDENCAQRIEEAEIERVAIRSVLTCETEKGVCACCYGWDLSRRQIVDIGEAVGIIAAQSIGEPGTQLTMRTFHIGGTAFREVEEREVRVSYPAEIVELPKYLIPKDGDYISTRQGNLTIRRVLASYSLPKDAKVVVFDGLWVNAGEVLAVSEGEEQIKTEVPGMVRVQQDCIFIVAKERTIPIKTGSMIKVREGEFVEEGQVLAEFDPYNEPILTEVNGKAYWKDIVKEKTLKEELDENTGLFRRVITEDREGKLQPSIVIKSPQLQHEVLYHLPHGAVIVVEDGEQVHGGQVLAKFPQELMKTRDITGGLPRVAELFEARHPKNRAVIAEIDGVVEFKGITRGVRNIIIRNEITGDMKEYSIPVGRHLKVHDKDRVIAGDQLTEGSIDPHDILRIKGDKKLQQYLVNEIQEVYRLQGVEINDKHIEIIIRQMLRKVEITDPCDTPFLVGELVDKFVFKRVNDGVQRGGGKPAQARPVLLGITKASLSTESFISAASFQETTRVLTEAALHGKVDRLYGLKENVIIGRLIPAGTGVVNYANIKVFPRIIKEE